MGTEYKIQLTQSDREAFKRHGTSLDQFLREGPGFLHAVNGVYSYNTTDAPDNSWHETVHIIADGLWITLYADDPLRPYLMNGIFDICGRLTIEDG